MKIGELRLIPKNTPIWSIALQEVVRFDKDMVVRITNTCVDNSTYFYGTLQLVLFEWAIPGIGDKANGDVGLTYDKTLPYELHYKKL